MLCSKYFLDLHIDKIIAIINPEAKNTIKIMSPISAPVFNPLEPFGFFELKKQFKYNLFDLSDCKMENVPFSSDSIKSYK